MPVTITLNYNIIQPFMPYQLQMIIINKVNMKIVLYWTVGRKKIGWYILDI